MEEDGIVRFFGGFTAEITVQEQHNDDTVISVHPVEMGAPITDHAYRNPTQLTIRAGWSAAYLANDNGGGDLVGLYDQILAAKNSATLISVQTGKRRYDSMLIKSVSTTTEQTTENVLMITVQLQEVILVETLQTTMPPASNRANPQATAGVTNAGTKTLQGPLNPNGTIRY